MKTFSILTSMITASFLFGLSGCGNFTDPISEQSFTPAGDTLTANQCTSITAAQTETILENFSTVLGNLCQFTASGSESNNTNTPRSTTESTDAQEVRNFLTLSGGFDGSFYLGEGDPYMRISGSTLNEGIEYTYGGDGNGSYLLSFADLNLTVDGEDANNPATHLGVTSFGLKDNVSGLQVLLKDFTLRGNENEDKTFDFSSTGKFYTAENCFLEMKSQATENNPDIRYYNDEMLFEAVDGSGFVGREDVDSDDILIDHKSTDGTLTPVGALECNYGFFGFGLGL